MLKSLINPNYTVLCSIIVLLVFAGDIHTSFVDEHPPGFLLHHGCRLPSMVRGSGRFQSFNIFIKREARNVAAVALGQHIFSHRFDCPGRHYVCTWKLLTAKPELAELEGERKISGAQLDAILPNCDLHPKWMPIGSKRFVSILDHQHVAQLDFEGSSPSMMTSWVSMPSSLDFSKLFDMLSLHEVLQFSNPFLTKPK